jgi:hypothetical protein
MVHDQKSTPLSAQAFAKEFKAIGARRVILTIFLIGSILFALGATKLFGRGWFRNGRGR